MLDIRLIREKPDFVRARLATRAGGDEAKIDDVLRAELRYQAAERVPTGERVTQARIVAVRFLRTDVAPTVASSDWVAVPLASVPARVFSEALMDVALVVSRP